jgi:hypothetical protein
VSVRELSGGEDLLACFSCGKKCLKNDKKAKKYFWYGEDGTADLKKRICFHCSVPMKKRCPCSPKRKPAGSVTCDFHEQGHLKFLEEKVGILIETHKTLFQKLQDEDPELFRQAKELKHAPSQKTLKNFEVLREIWKAIKLGEEIAKIQSNLEEITGKKREQVVSVEAFNVRVTDETTIAQVEEEEEEEDELEGIFEEQEEDEQEEDEQEGKSFRLLDENLFQDTPKKFLDDDLIVVGDTGGFLWPPENEKNDDFFDPSFSFSTLDFDQQLPSLFGDEFTDLQNNLWPSPPLHGEEDVVFALDVGQGEVVKTKKPKTDLDPDLDGNYWTVPKKRKRIPEKQKGDSPGLKASIDFIMKKVAIQKRRRQEKTF